jgi:hypothetical protein
MSGITREHVKVSLAALKLPRLLNQYARRAFARELGLSAGIRRKVEAREKAAWSLRRVSTLPTTLFTLLLPPRQEKPFQ